jgi:hypothetical protein
MVLPGRPSPLVARARSFTPFDHEPHGIGRISSVVLFLGIWVGCAMISFFHTTPPAHAGPILWVGAVIAAVAGYAVAGIRPLRPRRRACLALGVVCAVTPFVLGAALR